MRIRRARAAVLAGLVLLTACGGSEPDTSSADVGSRDLTPEDTTAEQVRDPGDLIYVRPVGNAPQGAAGWEITYRTISVHGEPVEANGMVYAPMGDAPPEGRPVVSWAHPGSGGPEFCAPTVAGVEVPHLEALLAAGYVVVATDYAGQGTADLNAALVGKAAAHDVLDIVRAARNIPETEAGTDVVLYGDSQGGHAVLWAGMEAPTYAPDLSLHGIVSIAPPMDVSVVMVGAAMHPHAFGYYAQIAYGFSMIYDDLELSDVFTPEGIESLRVTHERCSDEVVAHFAAMESVEHLKVMEPAENERWFARFVENNVGAADLDAPLLMLHGEENPVYLPVVSETGAQTLCGAGNTVAFHLVPGADDKNVSEFDKDRILGWIADRFAGEPPPSTC